MEGLFFNTHIKKYVKNTQGTVSIDLPVSNEAGNVTFHDILNELGRRFNIELNVKNNLYAFIIQNRMIKQLREFEKSRDMTAPGGHDEVVQMLGYIPKEIIEYDPRERLIDYIKREGKLTDRLLKIVAKYNSNGKPIPDSDKEFDKIIAGYEALAAEYQKDKPIFGFTDKELKAIDENIELINKE